MTPQLFPPRRPDFGQQTGRRRVGFGVSLAISSMLVLSCGGNPAGTSAGQGAANLPPQTNPAVKDADSAKNKQGVTRNLAGTVTDALTGEPVGKAVMFVEGVESTVSSTPIPAATPSAGDETDTGEGGGGGDVSVPKLKPFQLAQAAISPSPSLSPGASASPGTSPSPDASMSPGASPSAGPLGAVSPAPGASAAPAAAASGAPAPAGTPVPLKTVKADSKGKFELKELPEGTYSITIWAPGYQAETFQGSLPNDLDVKLRPLTTPKSVQHELKGVVRQANNQPASNVVVEASSMRGNVPGVRESSDDKGAFAMGGLLPGNYAVAAWTTGLDGEINQFAMVKEVPVAVGREKRTVSPTLVLRAVTGPVLLAGTVEGTAKEDPKAKKGAEPQPGTKPQNLRAFLRVEDGEIPLATVPVGADGYFRLRLPALVDGASYHLVASGTSEDGQSVYLHRYGITKSDPKLSLQLPDGPGEITVVSASKAPQFSWEAKGSDVSAYRVTIEGIGDDGDTIWQGWTTGTAIRLPASPDFDLLKEGESYRVSLAAIKLGEDGKLSLTDLNAQNWSESRLSKPTTFEVARLKPGQKPSALKPLALPASKAPAAPGAKPSPSGSKAPAKNPRIKPLDEL